MITLDRLRKCQRAIYRTGAFVYGPLLWEGSYGAVPVPQYDHLEHLDKGWIDLAEQDRARDAWDEHLAVVDAWEQEDMWTC